MGVAASEVFSAKSRLFPLEVALIRAVERGENFAPGVEDIAAGNSIRGELIRAMLIGTPLKYHPANKFLSDRRVVKMTPHGIRIVPFPPKDGAPLILIDGALNLKGLAAPGGDFLPPLHFERCLFAEPIELPAVHLQSLTLESSRFARLHAAGAKINGNMTLTGCRPRDDPAKAEHQFACMALVVTAGGSHRFLPAGRPRASSEMCPCPLCAPKKGNGNPDNCGLCCVIDFSSAEIAGELAITQTYLRAPRIIGRAAGPRGVRDERAADLGGVKVRDSIRIQRSTFVGYVKLTNAEIEDDVWVLGGRYIASAERPTFDFQFATIGGGVFFQAKDATKEEKKAHPDIRAFPVTVIGQISGIGLTTGEVWIAEGFYYGHDKQRLGSFPTVNFAKSDIGRSFKVGAYHEYEDPERPTYGARLHGEICLVAANVGKNLELHNLHCDGMVETLALGNSFFEPFDLDASEPPYLKLKAHGLKVDRRVSISNAEFRDYNPDYRNEGASDQPPAATELGRKEGVPSAIDLWKSTIGTGFRLRDDCSCTGAIRLNSCVIGREAVVGCKLIQPSEADQEGDNVQAGDLPLLLDISESTIMGHVKIGRRVPRAPDKSGAKEVAVSIKGAISLESTSIQGSLLLAHVEIDLSSDAAWREKALKRQTAVADQSRHREPNRIALSLRDCTCGSDLEVHALRWVLPEPAGDERPPASRALIWSRRRFRQIDEGTYAIIDLRGLQCGMLIDGFGAEWGLIYRIGIRLAGIRIGDVEPPSHKGAHSQDAKPEARLPWLAFQHLKQKKCAEWETPGGARPKRGLWEGFRERFLCSREEDFVAQSYDVFAAAYRKAGEDRMAEAILVEKKNVQNVLRFRRQCGRWYASSLVVNAPVLFFLAAGLWYLSWQAGFVPDFPADRTVSILGFGGVALIIALWPFCAWIFQMIFRRGFRYGLSPDLALVSFLFCIIAGWISVHAARNGSFEAVTNWQAQEVNGVLNDDIALVLDVEYEPTVAPEPALPALGKSVPASPDRARPPSATRREGQAIHAQPSPCNLNVSSLLYALDVFIPLIDLDQESRCTVRDANPTAGHDDYFWWRFAKAVYELLGWVVTSLVILTITGVLRRDLER